MPHSYSCFALVMSASSGCWGPCPYQAAGPLSAYKSSAQLSSWEQRIDGERMAASTASNRRPQDFHLSVLGGNLVLPLKFAHSQQLVLWLQLLVYPWANTATLCLGSSMCLGCWNNGHPWMHTIWHASLPSDTEMTHSCAFCVDLLCRSAHVIYSDCGACKEGEQPMQWQNCMWVPHFIAAYTPAAPCFP